jgi:hypothetical protein
VNFAFCAQVHCVVELVGRDHERELRAALEGAGLPVGLDRIVALHYCSSTSYGNR